MKKIALREEWEAVGLNDSTSWSNVIRERSIADFLSERDHIAAVKRYFIESLRQLRDELAMFKEEHPELPWSGG